MYTYFMAADLVAYSGEQVPTACVQGRKVKTWVRPADSEDRQQVAVAVLGAC